MSLGLVGDNTQAEVTFHPGYVLAPCVCARWSVLGLVMRSVVSQPPGLARGPGLCSSSVSVRTSGRGQDIRTPPCPKHAQLVRAFTRKDQSEITEIFLVCSLMIGFVKPRVKVLKRQNHFLFQLTSDPGDLLALTYLPSPVIIEISDFPLQQIDFLSWLE